MQLLTYMLSIYLTLCAAISEFIDCREAALHVLSIALCCDKLSSETGEASDIHLPVQDDDTQQSKHQNVHPMLAQWLPSSTPTSISSHPHGAHAADLHRRVLQQAQTQLQALHCFTQLCAKHVATAAKLPAQGSKRSYHWHLLAKCLHMFETYVSQLQLPVADAVPTDEPKRVQKQVRTQLRGEVHTLRFTLNDEDAAGLIVDDAAAIQPDLLALARATGEADRQV